VVPECTGLVRLYSFSCDCEKLFNLENVSFLYGIARVSGGIKAYPVCLAGLRRDDGDDIEGAGHGDVMFDAQLLTGTDGDVSTLKSSLSIRIDRCM
jgi:hypothetical protein